MSGNMTPQDYAALKRDIFSSLHCALPGIVESFDGEAGTADVRPAVKKYRGTGDVIPGGAEGSPYPLLRDVPVFMPVPFDVAPGDACLLVFADCDTEAWLASGEAEVPLSDRAHSLSDAFAFVGFRRGGAAV